jgi:hypothetical protein
MATVKLNGDTKQEIKMSLNSGIYFVRIETDKSITHKKIYLN